MSSFKSFATLAEAQAYAAKIDKALGYPKPGGAKIGGGIHVPDELCVTVRHADILVNGSKSEYLITPEVAALSGASVVVDGVSSKIDATPDRSGSMPTTSIVMTANGPDAVSDTPVAVDVAPIEEKP